jgi:hypothetical protein
VPEGIEFHDEPSKYKTVPEAPVAQPLDCPNITIEFRLLVVGGDAAKARGTANIRISMTIVTRVNDLCN